MIKYYNARLEKTWTVCGALMIELKFIWFQQILNMKQTYTLLSKD